MQVRLRIATTILALTLAACGTSAGTSPTPTMATSTAATAAATATPSPTAAAITVSDAWARAAISSASDATGNSAVYMTIKSTSSSADRLVRAASDVAGATDMGLAPLLSSLERARVPLRFMANLFAAGNEDVVAAVYRKLIAVRVYMRSKKVRDVSQAEADQALATGSTTAEEAEAIFRLTSLPTFEERFVVPPLAREMAIEETLDPAVAKPHIGFGSRQAPARRW